jgi:hypothetical protein
MRTRNRRRWIVLAVVAAVVVGLPTAAWVLLTRTPTVYLERRERIAAVPRAVREREAKHFVAQSLQLRNDIANEPRWEASFTEQEVNAWLTEDLMTHFADQVPADVRDPCVAFELDRITLGFRLDSGPIRTVITVEARVRVPEENTLALTVEKIRAGAVPIAADAILERIADEARDRGLDVRWERQDGRPVAIVHYTPVHSRKDIVLERLQVTDGRIRLSGRSDRSRGRIASPTLPRKRVLQSTFPTRRKAQDPSLAPEARSSTKPMS